MQKRTTDNELSTSENTTLDLKHMSYHIVLWIQKQRKEERLLNLISLPHITLKQMFKTKKISYFQYLFLSILVKIFCHSPPNIKRVVLIRFLRKKAIVILCM